MSAADLKAIMQKGRDFIAANLAECCREELEWQNTALLCNGKLREAASIFREVDATHAIPIAQAEISKQALEAVAKLSDDAALLDWVIHNRNMRVQGRDAEWFVLDCRNGMCIYIERADTYRDAIRAAMAKQAEEKTSK